MAARKAPLRTVKAGERLAKAPASVVEAAESGSHRDLLVAMRSRIARTVSDPSCPPRDLAALTRRLQDIGKEIEAIDLRLAGEAGSADRGEAPDEAFDASAV